MHVESATDGDRAFAVGAGSPDSLYLALRQGCSSPSPRLRDDARLALAGTLWLIADVQFRLLPLGAEPLEPLQGVRFESTRVHRESRTLHRFIAVQGFRRVGRRPLYSVSPIRLGCVPIASKPSPSTDLRRSVNLCYRVAPLRGSRRWRRRGLWPRW